MKPIVPGDLVEKKPTDISALVNGDTMFAALWLWTTPYSKRSGSTFHTSKLRQASAGKTALVIAVDKKDTYVSGELTVISDGVVGYIWEDRVKHLEKP